jgi:hypothetical protein
MEKLIEWAEQIQKEAKPWCHTKMLSKYFARVMMTELPSMSEVSDHGA